MNSDDFRRRLDSAHHVFFALIETKLAESEAAGEEVQARGDEAVVAHLLIQAVYFLGSIPRVGGPGEKCEKHKR